MFVGCDTGGTFTDFVMFDPANPQDGLTTLKLSSTPDDPSRAVLLGLSKLCGEERLNCVNHATTVATNALLEKQGGRVIFVTTEGFGDLLYLGRGQRQDLYALAPSRVAPPLEPGDCVEARERMLADGSAKTKLTNDECQRLLQSIPEAVDGVAICLLHSSANPAHEEALAAVMKPHHPRTYCSHLVAPGAGEYERGMTTVLAAYLAPKVERYLDRLQQSVQPADLKIVHSAGGLLKVSEARNNPQRLALSGPAAGLRGALSVGQSCGLNNLVTLDMGGTSTDVALLNGGELPYTWQTEIEAYPLRAPTLNIHTVGAGGGSLATADSSGLLRVGPRSAGASPGPACYGRGGEQPTVTDALCYNGFLPERLGDEGLQLRADLSEKALGSLATSLQLSVQELADGILEVAASHLGLAVRKVTTGVGEDPASFTLFPFGGAGPLMACRVAELLGMTQILVPACAGVLSAWGALTAPWEREWSRPIPPDHRLDQDFIDKELDALKRAASQELGPEDDLDQTELVARRYLGQGESLTSGPKVDFHELHERRFGFHRSELSVETTEVRLRVRKASLHIGSQPPDEGDSRPVGSRVLRCRGESLEVPIYQQVSQATPGPFLLFQAGSTIFVEAGWLAQIQTEGHLLLSRSTSP